MQIEKTETRFINIPEETIIGCFHNNDKFIIMFKDKDLEVNLSMDESNFYNLSNKITKLKRSYGMKQAHKKRGETK